MEDGDFNVGPQNKAAFIIKYDSAGEYQWLVMPGNEESPSFGNYGNAYNLKTIIDNNDAIHNLMYFKAGSHLNDQLIVGEEEIVTVIVNYDSNGELIDFIQIDMHPKAAGFYNYQLVYDTNLDRYYIADTRRALNDNILGIGEYGSEDNGFYLAAIDNQGEVLWFHQNEKLHIYGVGDLQLDEAGNIYISGKFSGGDDGFAGFDFEAEGTGSGTKGPFLVKLDPDGNLIWGTNAQLYSPYPGNSIVIDGNGIYVGFGSLNNIWGGIEIPHPSGTGLTPDIAIMRFNAQTGEAQELIYDQPAMSHDAITAMALDQNGDLVVGGYFGSDLFYGTDLHLHNNGADSDFFIAKYQTEKTVNPCSTPTNIVIAEIAAESVHLSWTPGADENQWEVVYGAPGFDPETAGNILIVDVPEVTLENLSPETDYIVYVRAICEEENYSAWSTSISFTTKELSIKDQQIQPLNIYPNPTTGILNIESETPLKSYQLYDLQGRLVQQGKLTQPQIDLSKIENGLYFLQIENQQGIVENLKVVKK